MNKDIKIYSVHQCPDPAMIDRYLEDTLDQSLKELVSRHLQECPLCADAIEGYNEVQLSRPIKEVTAELNLKVDSSIGKRKSRVIWWSVAALLVIALISGYLYVQLSDLRKSGNVTESVMEQYKTEPGIPVTNSDQTVAETIFSEPEKSTKRNPVRSSDDTPQVRSESEEILHDAGAVENKEDAAGTIESSKDEKVAEVSDKKAADAEIQQPVFNSMSVPASAAGNTSMSAERSVSKKSKTSAASEKRNMNVQANKAENTSPAISSDELKNLEEPQAVTADNTKSVAEIPTDDTIEQAFAGEDFVKVIELTEQKKYRKDARAQWLRASGFIRLNEFSEAKKVLSGLSSYDNPYKQQSRALLDSLSNKQ